MRKKALKKQAIRGRVRYSKSQKRFIFQVRGNNVGKLPRFMKIYFGRLVKPLKKFIIQTPKTKEQQEGQLTPQQVTQKLDVETTQSFQDGKIKTDPKTNTEAVLNHDLTRVVGKQSSPVKDPPKPSVNQDLPVVKTPPVSVPPAPLPPPIKLGSSKTPRGVVDQLSKSSASQLVATLPITGGRLDKTAEQENAAIGSSIPTLRNKIDGDDTIATPPPLKEISASTIGVKEMKEPNEAQKAASGVQKDVNTQAQKQKVLLGQSTNFKINPVKMDATTSLKTKLSGNIGVDTSLPSERKIMQMPMLKRRFAKEQTKNSNPFSRSHWVKYKEMCKNKKSFEIRNEKKNYS